MHKLLHIYSWGTILVAFFVLGLLCYWMCFPTKVIDYTNNPFPVNEKEIKQGETVSYLVKYCKYADYVPITTRTFVDGIVYVTPSFSGNWEMGCHERTVVVEVPKSLPEGTYKIEILHSFELNPIRTIEMKLETEKFNVIK